MKTFFMHLLDNKRLIFLSISIIFVLSYVFGMFWYSNTNDFFKSLFQHLFYLNISGYQNNYNLYMIANSLFIIFSTYLSTSFAGFIGSLFLIFLKSLQLSFSFIFVFVELEFSLSLLFLVFIQFIGEILFIYIISYMTINFSIYNMLITFFIKENFNHNSIINFILNYLIVCLVMLSILLMFRIYLVPLL